MLVRPEIYPDELERSYVGAVMRINGLLSTADLDQHLTREVPTSVQSGKCPTRLESISSVAGLRFEDFVCQHTMLPLRRGITGNHPDRPHIVSSGRIGWEQGGRRKQSEAFFCVDCVRADQETYGRSYWRREHQIPGLLWCPKHRIGLSATKDESAFYRSPSEYRGKASQLYPAKWVEAMQTHRAIKTYLDVCAALLETSKPFDAGATRKVLQAAAKTKGYRSMHADPTKPGAGPLVTDGVKAEFPAKWLRRVLPEIDAQPDGVPCAAIDPAVWQSGSGTSAAYALICALLFDFADDALEAIANAPYKRGRRRHAAVAEGINDVELHQSYVDAKGSYTATARSLGISFDDATRRLPRIGLPSLVALHRMQLRRAAELFLLEKKSLWEVYIQTGTPVARLESMLRSGCTPLAMALRQMNGQDGQTNERTSRRSRVVADEGSSTNNPRHPGASYMDPAPP